MSSPETVRREKIVILGGGIAALTTAFELSSQPGWQDRYEITVHTLGWRLGGKCASSRGPNARIEEHGIHGFMGSYFNAMPVMKALYEELGRAPGQPLATFETAFRQQSYLLLWEWHDGALRPWHLTLPTNDRSPADPSYFVGIHDRIEALLDVLEHLVADQRLDAGSHPIVARATRIVADARAAAAGAASDPSLLGKAHPLHDLVEAGWHAVKGLLWDAAMQVQGPRRLALTLDYFLTLVRGLLADEVARAGYDILDDENWFDWLRRHGAHEETLAAPLTMTPLNISYQFPHGDTTLPPRIGAGTYLRWSLQTFCYNGAIVYTFAAGTGETVIAPFYEVLSRRGVRFEFFNKVEALRLDAGRDKVAAVEIAVQAQLKDPAKGYQPLISVKGLPSWPDRPLYDQLVEGEALAAGGHDLESWWTPWRPVARRTLEAGRDFDRLVFAISLGAVPHICQELLAARPGWQKMVDAIETVQTQAVQVWFSESSTDLGWDYQFKNPTDCAMSATYVNPVDGQVDLSHLIPLEDWPADRTPKSLWYFCGLMSDHRPAPDFDDHDYPRRSRDRVRHQATQYLQAAIGAVLPKATSNARNPPGDPAGLDFSLLVDTRPESETPPNLRTGIARIESQFLRANIDPSERYVTSPPGTSKLRLKAWGSGFENLVLAGDWIYTGVNFGCVEGTVMSGKLASFAISGAPALGQIVAYPTTAWPEA